jgi:hypothetical protein
VSAGDGPFPIAPPAVRQAAALTVARAVGRWADAGWPVVATGTDEPGVRWFLRLRSADKDVLTLWLTLRQRTLRHEAQVMPAPPAAAEVHAYLLRRNLSLPQLRFALGPEDAVVLVGELPIGRVDDDELDRVVATTLSVVDDCYATAMRLGFGGGYRRRPLASGRPPTSGEDRRQ